MSMSNMKEIEKITIGSVVEMKKKHPCGSVDWVVKRIGMDVKLVCVGCQREIMIPRVKFNKQLKKLK